MPKGVLSLDAHARNGGEIEARRANQSMPAGAHTALTLFVREVRADDELAVLEPNVDREHSARGRGEIVGAELPLAKRALRLAQLQLERLIAPGARAIDKEPELALDRMSLRDL